MSFYLSFRELNINLIMFIFHKNLVQNSLNTQLILSKPLGTIGGYISEVLILITVQQ